MWIDILHQHDQEDLASTYEFEYPKPWKPNIMKGQVQVFQMKIDVFWCTNQTKGKLCLP